MSWTSLKRYGTVKFSDIVMSYSDDINIANLEVDVKMAQLCLAKVDLCILSRRSLRQTLVHSFVRGYHRDLVLLADAHDEVVDSLWAHIRKAGIVFFKPVVHMSRLGVRKQVQTFDDELGVGFQQKRTIIGSVQMMLVLCLRHRQITFDGTAIQI